MVLLVFLGILAEQMVYMLALHNNHSFFRLSNICVLA
jgi:hypothetical protein